MYGKFIVASSLVLVAILLILKTSNPLSPKNDFRSQIGDATEYGASNIRRFKDSRSLHGPTLFIFDVRNNTYVEKLVKSQDLKKTGTLEAHRDVENVSYNFKILFEYFQTEYPSEITINLESTEKYLKTGKIGAEPIYMVLLYDPEVNTAYLLDGWVEE